jgi:hypothetical protein
MPAKQIGSALGSIGSFQRMNGNLEMAERLTAWEEINPTTALAPQPERRVTCSGLEPATREQFAVELTACLILVAPVGMTEEARREWLSVAWKTVGHLPPDLLAAGCMEARKVADHPCKIVPAIIGYAEERLESRKQIAREYPAALPGPPIVRHISDRDRSDFGPDEWAELNTWLEQVGAMARYRPDGSKYLIENAAG